MGQIKRVQVVVNTTGGAGVATGDGRVAVPGGVARLVGLQVDYDGAAPATTDVTITAEIPSVVKTLLTLTNRNTDLPMSQVTEALVDDVGVDVVNTESPNLGLPICQGNLVVAVAQSDALTSAVTVDALFEVI